jgi:hypothetical protein
VQVLTTAMIQKLKVSPFYKDSAYSGTNYKCIVGFRIVPAS